MIDMEVDLKVSFIITLRGFWIKAWNSVVIK